MAEETHPAGFTREGSQWFDQNAACPSCNGDGKVLHEGQGRKCKHCAGTGNQPVDLLNEG